MYKAMISINTESPMLNVRQISSIVGGKGTIKNAIIDSTPAASIISLFFNTFDNVLFSASFSETALNTANC
ncbi:hypothetical protein SDC9_126089 [bioreactor metagenome]|uniref:Uncharacterized protein n=1 Tax=bioreactor metagenome TaxID=1076179 RepID=A0A645CQ82_9ZZZZ